MDLIQPAATPRRRSRRIAVAVLAAVSLGTIGAVATSAPANAAAVPRATAHGSAVHTGANANVPACADQSDNDSSVATVSQDFTDAGYDIYDSYGADDFVLTRKCALHKITLYGQYFNGSGPADYETILIWHAKRSGGIGNLVLSRTHAAADSAGTFTMRFPIGTTLRAGRYWISGYATMAFAAGGEWGWENSTALHGSPALFENPGDGLGTGCTTWGQMNVCIPSAGGPDYMFAIR